MKLVVKYAFFALVSTLLNLLVQALSFTLYNGTGALYLAMATGTVAGLVCKYILDKKWIFYHTPKDKKEDAEKFTLYALMGVFTTLIFWGTETAFYHFVHIPYAPYIGGAIGLGIGYVTKYFLDKRFVFVQREPTSCAKVNGSC